MDSTFVKGVRYFLLFLIYAAVFLYTVVFNNSTGWSLFFFLTLFFLYNGLSLLPSLKKIESEITGSLPNHVNELGRLKILFFKLRPTLFPIPKLKISFPVWWNQEAKLLSLFTEAKRTLFLFTGSKQILYFSWTPKKRGFYEGIPVSYEATDLFDLFSKNYQAQIVQKVMILPEIHPQAEQLLTIFNLNQMQQPFGETNFSIKNYRPYQEGDPLKFIDWKISSRQQELIYREYETKQAPEISLLFWGTPSKHFEAMLSLYYSLQLQLSRKKKFKQYLLGDLDDQLALATPKAFATIQPFSEAPIIANVKNQLLFIFTPEKEPPLMEQLEQLRRTNLVMLFDYADLNALLLPFAPTTSEEAKNND